MGQAALRINGAMSVVRNIMFFVFGVYTHCVARFSSDLSLLLSLSVFCSKISLFYLCPFGEIETDLFSHHVGCVWILNRILWASFGVVLGFLTFVLASRHHLAWQGRGRATQGIQN